MQKPVKGVPQGGVLSPLLSNIVLDLLDSKVELLIQEFDKGKRKRQNPEYTKLTRTKGGDVARRLSIPMFLHKDENFKRLRYIRYADDFLIGIHGSKDDCIAIRSKLAKFLVETLNLKLNLNKTKITHAQKESAKFLGHRIHITPIGKRPVRKRTRNGRTYLTRVMTRPQIDAPIKEVVEALQKRGFARKGGKPTRCGRMVYLPEYDIVSQYKQIERGILNYYENASNRTKFNARVNYILKYSCALTLCSKLRLRTLKKTYRKFGKNLKVKKYGDSNVYISYPNIKASKGKRNSFDPTHVKDPQNLVNSLSYRTVRGRKDLESVCSVCGSIENIHIHHIKALRKGRSKSSLFSLMQRINRKQVPVCQKCHIKIHKGLYDGPKLGFK
jgi:hypothetical protein